MAIYIGGKSLKDVYVGNKAVKQVFKGSSLLWERTGVTLSQNTGTSSSKLAVKGASATITVNTIGAWTVTVGASWLTANVTSGNDTGTFTVTAASNVHNNGRSATVTVKQTSSGQTATVTIYQSADSKNASYGNVTAGTITNTTIPASGTTTNYTATAGNGSQVITYTWASDNSSAGSETKTIAPSVASISATASSKGTTESGVTTVKSQAVTWSGYGSKSASGTMYIYQAANTATITGYGSWEGPSSWSGWSDYDYPYADTTGAYWVDASIGSGISCSGGSATVSRSAGHTVYHWKRQRRSGTQYRDVYYEWTSKATSTTDNGSSQTVYDYQQVANGTTAASDSVTLSIVANGNSRFSLSGTTLSHSTMAKNLVTDTCTVRATNAAATSVYKDASVSVTNTVGSYYDNGSWGSWSDTGNPYYVGSEWEGSTAGPIARC